MITQDWMQHLTPLNVVLISGIVWLSGVFIWLIKKFVSSYEQNTHIMTSVRGTLEGVDRKLDIASDRDLSIIKTLSAIHARGVAPAQNIEVVYPSKKQ